MPAVREVGASRRHLMGERLSMIGAIRKKDAPAHLRLEDVELQPIPADDGPQGVTMTARAARAAHAILGAKYGELVFSILEGARRGTIKPILAREVLTRCLPDTRPTPVPLPTINCAADLVEADRRLMAAANLGVISHLEWRRGQECILASWEIRKAAKMEEED